MRHRGYVVGDVGILYVRERVATTHLDERAFLLRGPHLDEGTREEEVVIFYGSMGKNF